MNESNIALMTVFDMLIERLTKVEDKMDQFNRIEVWKCRNDCKKTQLLCGELFNIPCTIKVFHGDSQPDKFQFRYFFINLAYKQNIFETLIYSTKHRINRVFREFSKTLLTHSQYNQFWKHAEDSRGPLFTDCALTCEDIELTPLANYKYVDEYLVHQFMSSKLPEYDIMQIAFTNGINLVIDAKSPIYYADQIVSLITDRFDAILTMSKNSLLSIHAYTLDEKLASIYKDVFYSNRYYEYHKFTIALSSKIRDMTENPINPISKSFIETYFQDERFHGMIDMDELKYILYAHFIFV